MKRDTILFVSVKVRTVQDTLSRLEKHLGASLRAILVVEPQNKKVLDKISDQRVEGLVINTKSASLIQERMTEVEPRILAATCHSESLIPVYRRILPHLPYIQAPSESSLEWSTDKLKMRQMLGAYDQSITPLFTLVSDTDDKTIDKVAKKVGFPLIAKPTGLAESLLVSQCFYKKELQNVLDKSFKYIEKVYKRKNGRGKPHMLVEQMMEGVMYSIDAYVDAKGKVYFCPLVYVETGRAAGFDDFFGYKRITPVKLKDAKQGAAKSVATKGIHALGLRSTTCHVELMKDDDDEWKIIEIGPRMGGFRHNMYELSYGIDHSMNDVLIRMDKKPVIPKRMKGFTCVMQMYSKQQGIITKITGTEKIRSAESLVRIRQRLFKGDKTRFAKNGGGPAIELTLFNKNRSDLLADIRRAEQLLVIKAERRKPIKK